MYIVNELATVWLWPTRWREGRPILKVTFAGISSVANGQAWSEQASKVLCPSCAKHQRFDGRIQQEEQIRRWWKWLWTVVFVWKRMTETRSVHELVRSYGSRHATMLARNEAQGRISEGSSEQQVVDIVGQWAERQCDQQQRTVSSVWWTTKNRWTTVSVVNIEQG